MVHGCEIDAELAVVSYSISGSKDQATVTRVSKSRGIILGSCRLLSLGRYIDRSTRLESIIRTCLVMADSMSHRARLYVIHPIPLNHNVC